MIATGRKDSNSANDKRTNLWQNDKMKASAGRDGCKAKGYRVRDRGVVGLTRLRTVGGSRVALRDVLKEG